MSTDKSSKTVLRRVNAVSADHGPLGLSDLVISNGIIESIALHRSDARWPDMSEVLDLDGRVVIPGLTDAHFHLFSTGAQLLTIDLGRARSIGEVLDVLAAAGEDDSMTWIVAGQLNEEHLKEERLPTLTELDRVFPQRPVFVEHRSLHFALCNSEALRQLDLGDTNKNGLLEGEAVRSARQQLMQAEGEGYVEKALRAASLAAARRGVTTVHAMEGGDLFGDFAMGVLNRVRGSLPIDVVVYWCGTDIPYALEKGFDRVGGDAFVDGTLGSSTAALRSPYADGPSSRGGLLTSARQLKKFFAGAAAAHLQAGMHAIGGRAIELTLRAIEAVPECDYEIRWRVEHCGDVTRPQLQRAARLGVCISTQPAFTYLRGGPGEVYEQRVGKARARRLYPIRWMLDEGLHVCGGSDSPITPPDPLLGLESCVNAWYPAQRTTFLEGLKMFTTEAAWCGGEEASKGDIRPGMQADLVVLGSDPLTCHPSRIHELEISLVIRKGIPIVGSLLEAGA